MLASDNQAIVWEHLEKKFIQETHAKKGSADFYKNYANYYNQKGKDGTLVEAMKEAFRQTPAYKTRARFGFTEICEVSDPTQAFTKEGLFAPKLGFVTCKP